MDALYFAYGSNLCQSRMRERVAAARPRGCARLDGYRLTLDKRSLDGSGKANLRPHAASSVYGALYRLSAVHWPALDAWEPHYERARILVSAGGRTHEAHTYVSRHLTCRPVAYDWYKALLLAGAAEHGLPLAWQIWLQGLPARPDPGDGAAIRAARRATAART